MMNVNGEDETIITTKSYSTRFECYQKEFTWAIENFSLCPQKPGEVLKSKKFSIPDKDVHKWSLYVYPSGEKPNPDTEDPDLDEYLSVYVHYTSTTIRSVKAFATIQVEDKLKKVLSSFNVCKIFETDGTKDAWGRKKLIKLNQLRNLKDDTLVIYCSLKWGIGMTNNEFIEIEKPKVQEILIDDLKSLFDEESISDLIIVANDDKEFFVHKIILSARSSVFAKMFEHEMMESKESKVHIKDFNGLTLEAMLQFIYSSEFNTEKCEVKDLLLAADKYDLNDLKLLCEIELCKNLQINNAVNYLILSDLTNASTLKTSILELIKKNFKKMVEADLFFALKNSDPSLYEEILKNVFNQ